MARRGPVPPRIARGGGAGWMGRPRRDWYIMAGGAATGLFLALAIGGGLWIQLPVIVLFTLAGVALGMGRSQKVWRFEEVLWQRFRFAQRSRRAVWRKERPPDVAGVVAPVRAVREVAQPADEREGFGVLERSPDVWWGLVTAFVFSLMVGVSVYLATGGAERIVRWWELVTSGL